MAILRFVRRHIDEIDYNSKIIIVSYCDYQFESKTSFRHRSGHNTFYTRLSILYTTKNDEIKIMPRTEVDYNFWHEASPETLGWNKSQGSIIEYSNIKCHQKIWNIGKYLWFIDYCYDPSIKSISPNLGIKSCWENPLDRDYIPIKNIPVVEENIVAISVERPSFDQMDIYDYDDCSRTLKESINLILPSLLTIEKVEFPQYDHKTYTFNGSKINISDSQK